MYCDSAKRYTDCGVIVISRNNGYSIHIMNKTELYLTLLLCSFCIGISADDDVKSVDFFPSEENERSPGRNPFDMDIIPFSFTISPEGYLRGCVLFVRLNTASLYTNVKIEKESEGIVHTDYFTHDADKIVNYDLSVYGSGEYTVTIAFYGREVYETVIVIE